MCSCILGSCPPDSTPPPGCDNQTCGHYAPPPNGNDWPRQADAPPERFAGLLLSFGVSRDLSPPVPFTHLCTGHENVDNCTRSGGLRRGGAWASAKARSLILWLSLACLHARRAKVKKGVNILGAQTREPRQWDVKQEMGNGGKHASATVLCQRLGSGARNR